jgi:uncharacterized protein (TIGR02466 family)
MELEIESILSNFLASSALDVDNQKIKEYCYKVREMEPEGVAKSNFLGWQSNKLDPAFAMSQVGSFLDTLYDAINGVHTALGFRNTYHQVVSNIWININQKGGSNITHNHPNCFFSGVFYVKCPPDCGKIAFINPVREIKSTFYTEQIELFNEFNVGQYALQPEENKMIVFPSWLDHYVEPNKSDEDRISIAFNTSIMLK